jgi:hypothetical protein
MPGTPILLEMKPIRPYLSDLKGNLPGDIVSSKGQVFLVLSLVHLFDNFHCQYKILDKNGIILTIEVNR